MRSRSGAPGSGYASLRPARVGGFSMPDGDAHTTPSPRARGQSIQMAHCHIKAVAHLFYGTPFTVSSDDSPSTRGKRDRSSGQLAIGTQVVPGTPLRDRLPGPTGKQDSKTSLRPCTRSPAPLPRNQPA